MAKAEEFFRIEDIPDHIDKDGFWRDLMERYGAEPFFELFKMAGGERLYIPHHKTILKKAIDRMNQVGFSDSQED